MMVQTVDQHEFRDMMRPDLGYEASMFLYEYYDQLSQEIGEPFYVDPVAIRCEWGEYASLHEARQDFDNLDETEHYVIENGVVLVRCE